MRSRSASGLQHAIQENIDRWIEATRKEESMAKPHHSIVAMGKWDGAGFIVQDAETLQRKPATATRMPYERRIAASSRPSQ